MNLIEKASHFDPNTTYPVSTVPDAILDLNVVSNVLEATLPGNVKKILGRWSGPDPLQVVSFSMDDNQVLHTIMNDDTDHSTPQVRFDLHTKVITLGSGVHVNSFKVNNFSDLRFDYHNESAGTMYAIAAAPKTTSIAGLRVVTATGVVITGSRTWGPGYDVLNTLNRKVDHASDGLLSSGYNLVITHTYPSPILFLGYNFKGLRADYATHSIKIEYSINGVDWIQFDSKSTAGNVMGHYEKIDAAPIQVLAVRVLATGPTAAGCGYFNVITAGWGEVEEFKPLNFHPDYFDVVEEEDRVEITPIATGTVIDIKPLGVKDYLRVSAVLKAGRLDPMPTGTGLIKFNQIERDTLGVMPTLPVVNLPRGKYRYRFTVNDSMRGKGFYYLAVQGNQYAFNALHHHDPGINTLNRTAGIEGEGEFNLCVDDFLTLNYWKPNAANLPIANIDGDKLATLELWRISEPDEEFIHPYGKPSAAMRCSPFVKIYEALYSPSAIRTFDALFTVPYSAGWADWSLAGNHVVVYVAKPFRLWRAALAVTGVRYHGLLKITYYGNGEIDMTPRQYTLVGAEGVWELATKDMPAGVYKFERAAATRVDGAWFFESLTNPDFSDFVRTNKIAPMASANDQGQVVIASSFYSAAEAPYQAFTGAIHISGWTSGAATALSPTTPEWLEIDLGTPTSFNSFTVANRAYSATAGYTGGIRDFQLQGWNADAGVWDVLHSVVGRAENTPGALTVHEMIGEYTYQKIRIVVTARNATATGTYTAIGRLEIYERVSTNTENWF